MAPEAETVETGTESTGVATVSTEAAGEQSSSSPASVASNGESLLSADDIASLREDPDKLVEAFNTAASKRFSSMKDLESRASKADDYNDFISSLESNPRDTVLSLAKRLGLTLAESNGDADKGGNGEAEDMDAKISSMVSDALGQDYEDLSPRLTRAILSVAETVAQQAVEKATGPIREGQEKIIKDSADREAAAALKSLEARHPDWKKYEKEMTRLSSQLAPGEGVSDEEYLENIYFLATKDSSEGDAARKVADRISKSAESSSDSSSVSEKVVSRKPQKPPTFREAYAAAKRGERLE